MVKADSKAREFVECWVESFNSRDLDGLERLEIAEQPEGNRVSNRKFRQILFEAKHKVVRWTINPWKQPKWSIFNSSRFEPTPTHMSSIYLENPDGFTKELFLAFAPVKGAYRHCYYVDIPRRAKVRKLDLPAHKRRIERFVGAANSKFRKLKHPEPVARLDLHFSLQQGSITISFDTRSHYEPGDCEKMSHYGFHTLLLPKWAHFLEDGDTLVGRDGSIYALRESSKGRSQWCCDGGSASLEEVVGIWLVETVKALRDAGGFSGLLLNKGAEFGVEEIEGEFGWPPYKERGKQNKLS